MIKKEKNATTLLVIIIILLIVLNFFTSNSLFGLKQQVMNLEYQLNNYASSLDGITETIQKEWQQKESIVASEQYIINSFDKSKREVSITFEATPKVYESEMTANFTYRVENGKEVVVPAVKGEGLLFTATVSLPLSNDINYGVTFTQGKTQQTQSLGYIGDLKDRYALGIEIEGIGGSYQLGKKKLTLTTGARMYVAESSGHIPNHLIEAQLQLIKNGIVLVAQSMKKIEDVTYEYTLKDYELVVQDGDVIEVMVYGKDTNDFTYEMRTESWVVKNQTLHPNEKATTWDLMIN